MIRRAFVTTIALPLLAVSAGCITDMSERDQGNSENDTTESEDDDSTRSETDIPKEQSAQGTAEAITTDSVVDPNEYDTNDRTEICLLEAGSEVLRVIESELETTLESVHFALYSDGGVTVVLEYAYDREGDVITSPNVDFEEMVAVTPESVTMSIEIQDNEFECTDEVVVREEHGQEV